ncbi:MAG: hypothetical protein JSV93_01890, partial [Candidatus Omnitrophota bacterium]
AQLQPAINPFGKVYDCCFIVNPAIAGSFEPLGHITEGRSLEDIMREKREHVRDATKCSSCNSWVPNQIDPYAKLENDYREGMSFDAQPFRISPISTDVPFIDEPDNSEFAKGKDSPNRFARVLIQKGPYRDFVQFLSEEAMDGYLGFRPFFGVLTQRESPMGKACKICEAAGKEWAEILRSGKIPVSQPSDIFEPKQQLLLDLLEQKTQEIYPELGVASDDIFDRRQVVWMLKWVMDAADRTLKGKLRSYFKVENLTFPSEYPSLPGLNHSADDDSSDKKIKPDYITRTSREMLDTLTGENGARRASLITQPCTIGLVLKANPEKNIEDVLKEQLAKEWDVIARKVEPKVLKERGLLEYEALGNIKYVIYVDDGTNSAKNLARLREFRGILEKRKQANPKEIIFAWVFSDEARSEIGDVAYMVGLEGEFLSVSWQMLTGQHFANFIYSKLNKPDAEKRITDLIDKIVKYADWMTRGAIDLEKLRKDLEGVKAEDLPGLFNGIKINLPIPRPLTPDLAEYQKADKAIQSSL